MALIFKRGRRKKWWQGSGKRTECNILFQLLKQWVDIWMRWSRRVGLVQNIRCSEVAHQLCSVHLWDETGGKGSICNLKQIPRLAESGRGDRWRQRKDERKQAKVRKFEALPSAVILVCIRHTVTDLSQYFFLTCPPPQLLAFAAGFITVDSAKTTSVRLESSVWYAPEGLWCLITFSVWGPVHLSSRIRHIASPSCPAHSSLQPRK